MSDRLLPADRCFFRLPAPRPAERQEAAQEPSGRLRVENRTATAGRSEQRAPDVLRPNQSLAEWGETRCLPASPGGVRTVVRPARPRDGDRRLGRS
jgi:hypothetical protein